MRSTATPIQRQLMRVILLITAAVLVLTCTAFFVYDYITFRQTTKTQTATLGAIIAANSTAALAFENRDDAAEILDALQAEKHIVAACLYDKDGQIFSIYPVNLAPSKLPSAPRADGFTFGNNHLTGFQPVIQGTKRLGTLYLDSDMQVIYERLERYGLIGLVIVCVSLLLASLLSLRLQRTVTNPILALADTARLISEHHNYATRATSSNVAELRLLTDAFNHMLEQIETQNQEITSFNQNLEHKVRERTHEVEMAKNELETVNDKLIKSNRDLEQFAYVASHDLQEPLRKIRTYTEMAERNLQDEALVKKYFEKISTSAGRMSTLIQAVLNYSRLSKTEEEFVEIDLNKVIENIKTDFELLISEKNATILSNSLPVIRGIPLQIHQLCLNLISNSLKFSQKPPVIHITGKTIPGYEIKSEGEVDKELMYVALSFKDNGIGFEPQYADKIFTIFQRLHSRQEYAGTGIGLALCKKIVGNHHGFITVHSELGEGAEFTIYLPTRQESIKAAS